MEHCIFLQLIEMGSINSSELIIDICRNDPKWTNMIASVNSLEDYKNILIYCPPVNEGRKRVIHVFTNDVLKRLKEHDLEYLCKDISDFYKLVIGPIV